MLSLNDSEQVAPTKRYHRSRVSNGTDFLAGIDGRSSTARRMRDLVADLRQHLGGNPSPAQEIVLRRAATLAAWAEQREAEHLTGKELDVQVYTTAVNTLRRLVIDIGLQGAMKDATPTLQAYLAERDVETADDLTVERSAPAEDGSDAAPVGAPAAGSLRVPVAGPPHGFPSFNNPIPQAPGGGDLMTDRPRPLSIPVEAEPAPEPGPAQPGDRIAIEDGRAFAHCVDPKIGEWWLLDAAGQPLERHASREACEKRAARLVASGFLK